MNGSTNTITASIPVPYPLTGVGLLVNSVTNKIWDISSPVFVIDGTTNAVTTVTGTTGGPEAAALNTATNYAYVAELNNVFAISGAAAGPVFSASPSPLAFGTQTQGTTSSAMSLTVANTGTANLTLTTVTQGGTNTADFTITANNCVSATVAVSGSCTVSVTFAPTTTSSETATLTFADNASGSPQVVTLTGTGVAPVPTPTNTRLTASSTSGFRRSKRNLYCNGHAGIGHSHAHRNSYLQGWNNHSRHRNSERIRYRHLRHHIACRGIAQHHSQLRRRFEEYRVSLQRRRRHRHARIYDDRFDSFCNFDCSRIQRHLHHNGNGNFRRSGAHRDGNVQQRRIRARFCCSQRLGCSNLHNCSARDRIAKYRRKLRGRYKQCGIGFCRSIGYRMAGTAGVHPFPLFVEWFIQGRQPSGRHDYGRVSQWFQLRHQPGMQRPATEHNM